jgi:hypothetical protein
MKTRVGLLILLLGFSASLACGQSQSQSQSFGVVIQGTDYDSQKDQTTFHLLNVSGKTVNAWFLSLQTKLPDGGLTAAGTSFAGIEMDSGGIASGAAPEDMVRPGLVIGVVSFVMYSDGTFEGNEGIAKGIIDTRKGRVQAQQKILDLINAALADPNEKHPTQKIIAQLKAELVSKTINSGYRSELTNALRNITNGYESPRMAEQGWEAAQLQGQVKYHQDRAATLKEVLK